MFKRLKFFSLVLGLIGVFFLSACNNIGVNGGAAPIYKGMILSDSSQSLHNGFVQKAKVLNLSTRLSASISNEDIIEIISDEMPFEIENDTDYFADVNQNVFITINLENPDGQAILRFTLNGIVYQSFQFFEGSDSENLILQVNSGDISGVREFTIDEIKYVENGTNEIKDAVFEGDRTVKLGVTYSGLPSVTTEDLVIGPTSFGVKAYIIDDNDLVANSNHILKAFIISNNEIIRTSDINVGQNAIDFTQLSPNTEYTFVIASVIDLLDGNGKHIVLNNVKNFTTDSFVNINTVVPAQESISFGITVNDVDQVGAVSAIELYKGETLIETLTDLSVREFTGLLSNNEYTIKVTYTYDLNDGVGSQTLTINQAATTLAKATPTVVIDNVVPTQTSIGFDITITDVDQVGGVSVIELYKGETVVQTLTDISVREFTDLLSNNEYQIKVTYIYDLNDANGMQTKSVLATATTLAKTAPVVTLTNEDISFNSIDALISITDPDGLNTISNIELIKNGSIVYSGRSLELSYSSLNYYTDYIIKVYYSYDLNEGVGLQSKTVEFNVKTAPYFNFIDVKVLNTTAVSEGDTIIIQANIDNPSNATYSKVVVNGVEYNVSPASTQNRLRVEILNNGQFLGGNTTLVLEEIITTIDGKTYNISASNDNSASVFINGNLEFVSIEYVDADLISLGNYIFPIQTAYAKIKLNNPTGYNIDKLIVNEMDVANHLIKVDNNTYYYQVNTVTGWNRLGVVSISYSNDYINKSVNITSNGITDIFQVASNDTVFITQSSDLLNMDDAYYYELANDINLAGINWFGHDFYGVFNGNGYSIKSMSNVASYKDQSINLGLFESGLGIIENINMKEITVIVNLSSTSTTQYSIIYGSLVAKSTGYFIFDNVSIDDQSTVSINNENGDNSMGGIIGYSESTGLTITNSINNGILVGNNVIGGLIGSSSYISTITIDNSSNNGKISGNVYIGGLIGQSNSLDLLVSKSFNSGSISGHSFIGGLIGSSSTSLTKINNSYNVGKINGSEYIGGIIGQIYSKIEINNSYNDGDVHGYRFIGGLIGLISNRTDIIINNSYNNGSISGDFYIGGLIGQGSAATIINSYNSGNIIGYEYIGGLIGQSYLTNITKSYNSGSINGTRHIGGLIGSLFTATITNSYNNGNIIGDYNVGGFIGYSDTSSIITNSYNRGNIIGKRYVGGFIGGAGIVIITNSYNSGGISDNDYVGGFVGVGSVTITNSYVTMKVNNYDKTIVAVSQLNDSNFYLNDLSWDPIIWNYESLDVENNKYPTLRK